MAMNNPRLEDLKKYEVFAGYTNREHDVSTNKNQDSMYN